MFRSMAWFATGVAVTTLFFGIKDEGWVFPPTPDPGHRLYGAVSEKGAAAILQVLALSNLNPKLAFDAGPTHQVVLDDGQRTVIGWFDDAVGNVPKNAISIAVIDPVDAANKAAAIFNADGFASTVNTFKMPGGVLAAVSAKAFVDSAIVYRLPWFILGKPQPRPLPRLN